LVDQCLDPSCHKVMRRDCASWRDEIAAALPSVLLRALDEKGEPLSQVDVSLEGRDEPLRANSEVEIDLDPGSYRLVARRSGYVEQSLDFQLAAGERAHVVTLRMTPVVAAPVAAPPPAEPPPETARPLNTSWPFFALAGVGAVGFAGLVGFGVAARNSEAALDDCSPACSPDVVDGVRTDYLLANVGLGVGIAGVTAAAAWLLFVPVSSEKDAVRVGLVPQPGGAATAFSGKF
jgi:hypothetical protein